MPEVILSVVIVVLLAERVFQSFRASQERAQQAQVQRDLIAAIVAENASEYRIMSAEPMPARKRTEKPEPIPEQVGL